MPTMLPAYCRGCGPVASAPHRHRGEPACRACRDFARDAGLSPGQVYLFLYMLRRIGFDPKTLD